MSKIIGIDLGTTYSAIAYLNGNKSEIIVDDNGNKSIPSIVTFHDNTISVGEEAKKIEYMYPNTTIKRIKRKIGTDYKININNKEYTPEEISAFILKYLKNQAEQYLKEKISDVIITVPAYFNDNQRQATKIAGKIAGLNVLRIINEPTAAALAYGITPDDEVNIVVYDLGGGTFDISILNVAEGIFEVVATAGDNHLGGEDFNQRIMDLIISKFKEETGIDISNDNLAVVKLWDTIEKCKIELSSKDETHIYVPFITADESGPKDIDFKLTRKEFEILISDYIDRTIDLCKQALKDAKLNPEQIDKIILTGGSTRIPLVREKLKNFFGKEPDTSIDPDEAVARGAALHAGIISGDISGIVLVDVTPLSLGIEVENGYFVPIIERNTPIPTSSKRIFTTIVDNQKCVDIHILQGESMYANKNVSLGKFRLESIRKAKKGEPRIEVTFELDVNGILNVTAVDLDTLNSQSITIVNNILLSDEKIKEITDNTKVDDYKNLEIDKLLILKNKAETIISKINNSIPPSYKNTLLEDELNEIYKNINECINKNDKKILQQLIERLEVILSELNAGQKSYGVNIA